MAAQADLYVAAFRARCDATRSAGQPAVDAPGIVGLLPAPERPAARLLVTDDRARDALAGLLPDIGAGMIAVFAAAARCVELVGGRAPWRPERTTALVHGDLRTVPDVPLPGPLRLRPVRRLADDPADGVPLLDVAAAVMRAEPRIGGTPETFAAYLGSMSAATRLFAATDGDGVVRATSGCSVFGTAASVILVDTDPGWRRRGIGQAMTAAAVRAARGRGARYACLDATDAGLSLYLQLGFEAVSPTTRFFRNA